uniref:histidine kinase n=1 Tax=Chromera velia CCMP2878 TaxID=1169474 RepID=A0A0G4FX65_9ALVE|eukprot:Cvel_3862.t1-p1 / transcript=Cvel_3862.t1 / gene=Cvel_3862 / organism=Chromera_velia_CCMP2878 / gene_product=Ethylene receptor 1, putative / transcript_product=Ethylene receptor 1, putative / location=Cvel_scaffold163:76703-81728(-) / protein_length=997 / sequence_SO=supercontig / SO=protein_coding / is_pseudo=false
MKKVFELPEIRSVLLTAYEAFWEDAEGPEFFKFRTAQLRQQLRIFSAVYGTMSLYCLVFTVFCLTGGFFDFFSFVLILMGIFIHWCLPLALLVPEGVLFRFREREVRLDLDETVFLILVAGMACFGISSIRTAFTSKPLHLALILSMASWRAQGLMMSLDLKSRHWSILQAVVFFGFTSVLCLSTLLNESSLEQRVSLISLTVGSWLGTSFTSRFYRMLRWRSVYGGFEASEKQLKAEQRNNKFLGSLDLKSRHWSILQAVVFFGFTSVLCLSTLLNESSLEQRVSLISLTVGSWLGTSFTSRFYRMLRWRSVYGGFEASEKQLKAEQRNNKFLGYIMHEVRNPLQGALLVLNALRSGLLTQSPSPATSKKTSLCLRASPPRSPCPSSPSYRSGKSWSPGRKRMSPSLQMRRLQAARPGSLCGPSPAASSPAPSLPAPSCSVACSTSKPPLKKCVGIAISQEAPPPSPTPMRHSSSHAEGSFMRGCSACASAEIALEECKGKAAVLEIQLQHIVSVCSDVLQLEKLENGRFEIDFTQEDPLRWFESLLAVQRETFKSNQIRLHEKVTVAPELRDWINVKGKEEGDFDEEGDSVSVGLAAWLRLGQAAQNFFSNAVKFCPKGGRGEVTAELELHPCSAPPPSEPTVSLREEEKKGSGSDVRWVRLRLSVRDNGVGIESAEGKNLFLPYSQIRAGEFQKGGGTGLGLCISKEFVDRHKDGKIGFRSEGRGTGADFFFEVTIPLEQVRNEEAEGEENEGGETVWRQEGSPRELTTVCGEDVKEMGGALGESVTPTPRTPKATVIGEIALPPLPPSAHDPRLSSLPVLLVDDSMFARMGIASLLQRLKIPFVEVEDGSEAVRRVEGGERFRLVLMDRNMKHLDGELATAQLLAVIREAREKSQRERQNKESNLPHDNATECPPSTTDESRFCINVHTETLNDEEWRRGVEPLVVGLTGDVGAEATSAFHQAGAFVCLQKPLTAKDLRTLLDFTKVLSKTEN